MRGSKKHLPHGHIEHIVNTHRAYNYSSMFPMILCGSRKHLPNRHIEHIANTHSFYQCFTMFPML